MAKYIDVEKLIAYLNKKMQSYKSKMVDPRKYPIDHIDLMAFLAREYQAIIANVSSLQQEQPEVDLEKGLADYCHRYYNYDYPKQAENGTGSSVMPHIIEAAKYFYELGLNARKEE